MEGLEILLWLGIMGFVALRSAMQRQKQDQAKRKAPTPLEGSLADTLGGGDDEPPVQVAERPRSARQSPARDPSTRIPSSDRSRRTEVTRRAPGAPARPERREESTPKRGGLLSKWQEIAAEFERQMEEQQAAAREAARRAREAEAGESERLVVVPGRRVTPAPDLDIEEIRQRESHWSDWQTDPGTHGLHAQDAARPGRETHAPHAVQPLSTSRREASGKRGAGLARLESYPTLQRAIILSELLGPAPGIDGVAPAERRLATDVSIEG